jgi:hypothetical protein
MAEPSSPVVSSTPKSQPSEIQKRYEDAGYARNAAELRYNNAKKEFGADSPEAKTALTELQAAQAKVEAIQAELRG